MEIFYVIIVLISTLATNFLFLLMEQVTLFWSCLLLYGVTEFFKWAQLLSTWKGVGFTAVGLALVTGIMHVFIMFSQSERSSSARAARDRVKKDWKGCWCYARTHQARTLKLIPRWIRIGAKVEATLLWTKHQKNHCCYKNWFCLNRVVRFDE